MDPEGSISSERPLAGALNVLGAAVLFASMAAIVKLLSAELPSEMIVFARSALAALVAIPLAVRGGVRGIVPRHLRLHLARAFSGLAAMYTYFWAIGRLPLAEAMLLTYSAPLFIPFIARAWIGEPLPRSIAGAAATGFLGIALILKPGPGVFEPASLVGLLSGILTATAFVSLRQLSLHGEPLLRVVFWFSVLSTVIAATALPWRWQTPPVATWAWLGAMGVLAAVGQLFLTRGYALAAAARVGPFSYATVVFGAILAWAVWGEVPDALSAVGIVLVVAAGFLAVRA